MGQQTLTDIHDRNLLLHLFFIIYLKDKKKTISEISERLVNIVYLQILCSFISAYSLSVTLMSVIFVFLYKVEFCILYLKYF